MVSLVFISGIHTIKLTFLKRGSSSAYLEGVRVPILGLNAQDDPIVFPSAWPEPDTSTEYHPNFYTTKVNPLVGIYHTEKGGHLGWFEGGHPFSIFKTSPTYDDQYPLPKRWFPQPISKIIDLFFSDKINDAPGSNRTPVKDTNSKMWLSDDETLQHLVGYKLIEDDEVIHGGENKNEILFQGL